LDNPPRAISDPLFTIVPPEYVLAAVSASVPAPA
jgi:hypothetical protein